MQTRHSSGRSWGCLIDGILQEDDRFKGQDLSGGDRYLLAGLRIAPLAIFAGRYN